MLTALYKTVYTKEGEDFKILVTEVNGMYFFHIYVYKWNPRMLRHLYKLWGSVQEDLVNLGIKEVLGIPSVESCRFAELFLWEEIEFNLTDGSKRRGYRWVL